MKLSVVTPGITRVEKSVKSWRMTDMKTSRLAEAQITGFLKQADAASPASLGRYSGRERVRESGLRNNNYVDEAYDPAYLEILERVVSMTGPLT